MKRKTNFKKISYIKLSAWFTYVWAIPGAWMLQKLHTKATNKQISLLREKKLNPLPIIEKIGINMKQKKWAYGKQYNIGNNWRKTNMGKGSEDGESTQQI